MITNKHYNIPYYCIVLVVILPMPHHQSHQSHDNIQNSKGQAKITRSPFQAQHRAEAISLGYRLGKPHVTSALIQTLLILFPCTAPSRALQKLC